MAEYPGADWAGVSPNKSPRNNKVRLFIIHHYASTQSPEAARRRFMASNDRSVSPNYQVNADGSVFEIVPPDRYRAWTTGQVDHQAVTCETQNTSGAPHWGISNKSMEAIAHLVAWASKRYGFPIQRGRVTGTTSNNTVQVPGVVGHNETPAGLRTSTACPGPSMDINWIINRARQIAGPQTPTTPAMPEEEDDNMKMLGWINPDDKRTWYAEFDTGSGFWHQWVSSDLDYIRAVADKWTPDGIPLVSLAHRDGIKEELDRISGQSV